jgi:RNA polymerase sigma-70 factor, ECF subfamily
MHDTPPNVADEPSGAAKQTFDVNTLVKTAYDELKKVAGSLLQDESAEHTWGPTELVNEAYLRLARDPWLAQSAGKKQFFFAAARAMRELLVEHARGKRRLKRGGGRARQSLHNTLAFYETRKIDVIALNDALVRLEKLNRRQAQVVELRFFGGCTIPEVAEQLEVSIATVENDFRKAKAFLYGLLGPE